MSRYLNRREALKHGSAATAAVVVLGTGRRAVAAPAAEIHEIKTISQQPQYYHGWSTVACRRNGQLLLVYSGGREGHVCPFGRVEMMRSDDGGRSWTWPRVLLDSATDDRDAGVLETTQGSILVTTFLSNYYEASLAKAMELSSDSANAWPADRLERWQAVQRRLSDEQRKKAQAVWSIRSTDDGATWSSPIDSLVSSPHGPIQLADGRLLYLGNELWRNHRVGACESTDDGQSWSWLSGIPTRDGDDRKQYWELHAVESADGRIIAQIRNHNQNNYQETLQSESSDGGKTWGQPHAIGVWGLPSHLLRLRDDRLVMTYGYRRAPFGNQLRISEDHGRSWSEPIVLSSDGVSRDLGYPSTVELADGSLLSVWYEHMKDNPYAVLRQARWSLFA